MQLAQEPYDVRHIFNSLKLASPDQLDSLIHTWDVDAVVCFVARGSRICLPINMGKFLNDGIYAETAYQSHLRRSSSQPPGSRRVAREFGIFQLTLLMSKPIYNDVRKKIYRILAFLCFNDGMFGKVLLPGKTRRPLDVLLHKMLELL